MSVKADAPHAVVKTQDVVRPILAGLTGLRFLAAFWVLLYHQRDVFDRAPNWIVHIVDRGFVGVGLFFILSGFVLAYNYVGDEGMRVDVRSFMVARVARVYPVYIFALLVAAPVFVYAWYLSSGPDRVRYIAAAATTPLMLQSWVPATAGAWNAPGWSLSNEAFFYALFPVLAAAFFRQSMIRLLLISVAFYAFSVGLAALSLQAWTGDFGEWVYHNPVLRLPEFAIGVALGCAFIKPDAKGIRTPRPWLLAAAIVAAIFVLIAGGNWDDKLFYSGLLAPAFAGTILGLATAAGPIAAILGSRVLVLLGEASYALYLLHKPIWKYMSEVAPALGIANIESGAFTVVYALTCVACSIVVLKTIEEPARRWVRGRARSPSRSPAVASAR